MSVLCSRVLSINLSAQKCQRLSAACAACAASSQLRRSFTDIAFIDFQDVSQDWSTNGIIDAGVYAERLGKPVQSLNDFKYSCNRLGLAGKLPMPFQDCEARRQMFGNSIKVIRYVNEYEQLCSPGG